MEIELNEQQVDWLKNLLEDELEDKSYSATGKAIISQILSKLENGREGL